MAGTWRGLVVGALVVGSAGLAACTPSAPPPPGSAAPAPPLVDRPWPMHTIAGTFRGANGLGAGDVNGDGLVDYLTNYEFDQRYILSIHPPAGTDPRGPWQQVQVWPPDGNPPAQYTGVNPESSALIDVDGDGNLDIVGAQGESLLEFWEGNSPGIRIIFGPGPAAVTDPFAWTDAGRVPSTTTFGHLHWVTKADLSGDGIDDIVAGGRLSSTTNDFSGIFWLEVPADPAQRRNLAAYQLHFIDPDQKSGHQTTFADLDGDGDLDAVVANADFDTPDDEEGVFWYENPGAASPDLRAPWTKRTIYQAPEFHTKPQVAIGDLDGDGLEDIVTMTEFEVLWFKMTSTAPVTFTTIKIPKVPATTWLTRPVRMADVNGDGKLDLVGMMTHRGANLPQGIAAVFWMQHTGPALTDWTTHVIRWGSGHTALIPEFGEKWDQVDVVDVDGDGDLDLVANCEEWWMQQPLEVMPYYDPAVNPSTVAVVWFENVVGEPEPLAPQTGDRVEIEAEEATRVDDGAWTNRSTYPGWSGTGYLQLHNAISPTLDPTLPGEDRLFGIGAARFPGVHYRVEVTGGTYALWVRRWAPFSWGYSLGGTYSDSAWLSVNGGPSQVLGDTGGPFDTWVWERLPATLDLTPGVHDLALRQRDRGVAYDRIVLTTDLTWTP